MQIGTPSKDLAAGGRNNLRFFTFFNSGIRIHSSHERTNIQRSSNRIRMSIYEEIEFEDLDFNPKTQIYTYPCPCGDTFTISLEALWDGEDIATCPSCTLRIEIIYDEEDLPPLLRTDDDDDDEESVDEGNDEKDDGVKNEGEEEEKKDEEEEDEKKKKIDDLANITRKSLAVK